MPQTTPRRRFLQHVGMQNWNSYLTNPKIRGRPIPTIGSETPNLVGDFWIQSTDTFTHLLLPTISLMLISFAGYTRYARGGMWTISASVRRTA